MWPYSTPLSPCSSLLFPCALLAAPLPSPQAVLFTGVVVMVLWSYYRTIVTSSSVEDNPPPEDYYTQLEEIAPGQQVSRSGRGERRDEEEGEESNEGRPTLTFSFLPLCCSLLSLPSVSATSVTARPSRLAHIVRTQTHTVDGAQLLECRACCACSPLFSCLLACLLLTPLLLAFSSPPPDCSICGRCILKMDHRQATHTAACCSHSQGGNRRTRRTH